MRIAGKTLNEYLVVTKKFLAIIFIAMGIIVVLRLSHNYPAGLETLLGLLAVMVISWAGWTAVKDHGFNIIQAGLLGFLLSFGTHWTLPFFHSIWEVLYLFLINSVIFSVVAMFGGWLATIVEKFRKSKTSQ